MFHVNINNQQYKVVFQHVQDQSIVFVNEMDKNPKRQKRNGTYCHICKPVSYDDDNNPEWNVFWSGASVMHPGEQPVKNTGRKIALTRALKETEFDREIRGMFWDAYFATRGKVD